MKKILAVIILVVLALASFNVLSLPHARAQSSQDAQVLSYSWYVAPSTTTTAEWAGDLIAVGEVQNTGMSTLGVVWLTGQASNSSGTIVAASETAAMASNLAPGQKAPFYMDFTPEQSITQDQSWVANVTGVTLEISNIVNSSTTQYSGLTIPSSTLNGTNNGGTYTVNGAVEDTGDQSVSDVVLIATFYNSTGGVVALSSSDLGTALSSGQSMPFTVTPWDNTAGLSSEITSYAILTEAVALTATATPKPTPTPTVQPTSSPSSSKQPVTNSGILNSWMTYTAVIVIVAVVAVLAGLMLLRRRSNSSRLEVPPPPPPPPEE